jgi:hypothetical protein
MTKNLCLLALFVVCFVLLGCDKPDPNRKVETTRPGSVAGR